MKRRLFFCRVGAKFLNSYELHLTPDARVPSRAGPYEM